MQKFQTAITSPTGDIIPNAVITILTSTGSTPIIYAGNGVNPYPTNQVTTNSQGEFSFYAANGRYSYTVAATNFVTEAYTDFLLFDPADAPSGTYSIDTEYQLATAGQTVITLTQITYIPGSNNLSVYVNGARLIVNVDYAETSSTQVTFTNALALNDEVVCVVGAEISEAVASSNVSFLQAGTGAVSRSVRNRLRDTVSVKDFGAVGNGVTDDTAAIQAAMTFIAADGGVLYFPRGTYNITSLLAIASAAKPFAIVGAGRGNTKIVRASDFASSMLSINTSNYWTVSDLTLDANHSTSPNGNHGLVWYNCSYVRVIRVEVLDWKNSAIIGYTSPASTGYVDNIIEDCWVDGNNASNNGILIADLVRSGIRNCSAVNIGKTGSPCYALQLKNGCQDSLIEGGLATGATIGVACGNYDVSGTHTRNRISGVRIFDCDVGIAFGSAIGDHASNLLIDMNNSGLAAIDFNSNSVGCTVRGAAVYNLASGKQAARFRSGDTDNVVDIDTISNSSGLVQAAADFNASSLRNSARLRRYVNPTTVSSTTTTLVSNTSGSQTNVFDYDALPIKQLATIASGGVTIRDALVKLLRLDTEAAAATDDLDSIANGTDGQIITLETTANARDVVVKHLSAGGNIRLNGSTDFTLDGVADSLTLVFKSVLSNWCEVSGSNNV